MVKQSGYQHHQDHNKDTTQGPTPDYEKPLTTHEQSASKPRRNNSSVFEPLIEQSIAGETASAGRRRRIQLSGRRLMLMVKFYSCLGWPFKSQASVWQLSQADESMVPQSRPSSKNSGRQDDVPRSAAGNDPLTLYTDSNPLSTRGNIGNVQNDHSSKQHSSTKTSSVSVLLEDRESTQMASSRIDCPNTSSGIKVKKSRSQTTQNLSGSDDMLRSSLPKGVSARRVGVPQPWIETSVLDGIDGTPLFNCDNEKPCEEESFESIFLLAVKTPLPDTGLSIPTSPVESLHGYFNQAERIDALFQQAIRTPLPDETPAACSDIQLKPSPSSSRPPNYSLPLPKASFSLPLPNQTKMGTISPEISAAQKNFATAADKPVVLHSLLEPICLTPMPTIPSLQADEASIATPLQQSHFNTLSRIPKRYSLRLRSRFGSNKSTKPKAQEPLSHFNQELSGRFQISRNSHRERCDSAASMQTPAKTVWSRCSTPLLPLDLPRGRYRPYVPDFPSFDPTQFALSPNFDDEVRMAAAVRLPDGEDDDRNNDDDDDSVYDEDEEDTAAAPAGHMPMSASAPSLLMLQRVPTKPLVVRAWSLRRRSRDGLSFVGLRRSRLGSESEKGAGATALPAASALAPTGPSMFEEVCNRCRVKLASVWPGISSSATAVAA